MNDIQRKIFNDILNSSTENEIESLKLALYNNAKGRRTLYEQLNPNLSEFRAISIALFKYSTNETLNIAKINVNNILKQQEITLTDSMDLVKNIYDIFTCLISSSEMQMYQELQDKHNTIIKNHLDVVKLEKWNDINKELSILPSILRHPISMYMTQVNTAETIDERVEKFENFIDILPSILKGTMISENLSTQHHIEFFINVEHLIGSEKARQFEINIIDLAVNRQLIPLTNLDISEILNNKWTSIEGKALADYSKKILVSCSLDDTYMFDSTFLPSYCGKTWITAKFKQIFIKKSRMANALRKIMVAPTKSRSLNDYIHDYMKNLE